MIRSLLFLHLYFIALILSHSLNEEFLLCRKCGHEIAYIKHIDFRQSPYAIKTWNDTKFVHSHGPDRTYIPTPVVQLVRNGLDTEFNLLTVTQASMRLLNETTSIKDTWFPEFKWTIGLCPQCMAHIGWYFEATSGDKKRNFFALVMDSLFDEREAEELIMKPRLKMF